MKNKQRYILLVVFLFVTSAFIWFMTGIGYSPYTWQFWIGNGIVWISYIRGCVSGGIEIERAEK